MLNDDKQVTSSEGNISVLRRLVVQTVFIRNLESLFSPCRNNFSISSSSPSVPWRSLLLYRLFA